MALAQGQSRRRASEAVYEHRGHLIVFLGEVQGCRMHFQENELLKRARIQSKKMPKKNKSFIPQNTLLRLPFGQGLFERRCSGLCSGQEEALCEGL